MSLISSLKDWQRRRTAEGFRVSGAQWARVEQRLPFLDFLPAPARARLRQMALEFLAGKQMAGAHGFEVSDEVRLSVALQACLPVLELGLSWYDGWVGIVVYPDDFVIPRRLVDDDGVMHEYDEAAVGEAWPGGPVLLSWRADRDRESGLNVVIHEFAHKLDMAAGELDGMPRLHANMRREDWHAAFSAAYADFCAYVDAGGDGWLDPYAAENPAEFFAVVSEAFFETPTLVEEDMPAVYAQLRRFYRQDPAEGERRLAAAAPQP